MRFVGKKILFIVDNVAAVIALEKGYSTGDPWATTLIRAAKVVASGIGASLVAEWEPRRSCRGSRISDNLTHNILQELVEEEMKAYLEDKHVTFPPPILDWMSYPAPDRCLGLQCLNWIKNKFKDIYLWKPLI